MIHLRIFAASKVAVLHLASSIAIAVLVAAIIFLLWYPYPFYGLTDGRDIFLIVLAVAVIFGPLLIIVIFNPVKSRIEILLDLALIVAIQLFILGYGLHILSKVRPLFLVQEIDRFKVVLASDLASGSLTLLPSILKPSWYLGPITVAIREPKNTQERQKVMFESVQGGRDYAERPEFYLPYEGKAALKSLQRAKPLAVFLQKQPSQEDAARKLAAEKGADMAQWLYLPIVARQDWVAVLDHKGQIQGFLKGEGF
ncbi:hypothetical protein RCH06_000858 [Polaromonas sp. CG_9.5]|uniref:pilus assembly protein n=1 Tax=Polaromonas sp. CG_9.5 TaxID=3071705 RepID=UPI002E0961D3|nr:hypothetical protein [Polaromonas sp. CG_9.5]